MPDPNEAPAVVPLEGWSVLEFSGADAPSFLNGQLSHDVLALLPGGHQLSSCNSPKGRVVALLHLSRSDDRILGALPSELARPLAERLQRYVLRAKVKLRIADELVANGHADDPTRVTVGPTSHLIDHEAFLRWRRGQIAGGRPQVYAATSEAFVAQMLNLDLLDAISFQKGCYTGQEIIARTQNLGRIKRRMLRFAVASSHAFAPGDAIALQGRGSGTVVDAIERPDGRRELLAVLQLEPENAAGAEPASALAAEALPLPYGF